MDRKGESFPVVKAWGCRNEILNGKTLFLADKAGDYQRLGLESVRLMFTTETPEECVRVLERYQGRGRYKPGDLTRGCTTGMWSETNETAGRPGGRAENMRNDMKLKNQSGIP